jgi:hypothetical protein
LWEGGQFSSGVIRQFSSGGHDQLYPGVNKSIDDLMACVFAIQFLFDESVKDQGDEAGHEMRQYPIIPT